MTSNKKIHLLSLDMGYGHQRAAYPLVFLSNEGVIAINDYPGISLKEKNYWRKSRQAYEKISYFKRIPIVGKAAFSLMDYFQKIDDFYPYRDLSKKSIQQITFLKQVKKGLGKNLIENLNKNPLPLVSTFFIGAYIAEHYNYKEDIYCLLCDADVSRAWAMPEAAKSRVKYLVPTERSFQRLKMYGVDQKNIILTGFPLPKENIGGLNKEIIKEDLSKRLMNLDPRGVYQNKYQGLLKDLNLNYTPSSKINIEISFVVGGAGAQRQEGIEIVKSIKNLIIENKIKFNLVAGFRQDVYDYFFEELHKIGLNEKLVKIIFHKNKAQYFNLFNQVLRTTDILWTKPSELSFYSGLGMPLILNEPIGAQEFKNRDWLLSFGGAYMADNLKYSNEWLIDWLNDGRLVRSAINSYLSAESMGTYNIEKYFSN
jgi:hypothetical protein